MTVRVSDSPPFYSRNESGEWSGLMIEMSQLILKEAGCTPNYRALPWARALIRMKTGKLDMLMNLSMNEERKKYMYFVGPVVNEDVILMIRKDIDVKIQSLDDFKKLPGKIGKIRGSFRGKAFEEKLKTDPEFASKFALVSSKKINQRKLFRGRIIGLISTRYKTRYQIKTNPKFKDFKIHPYIILQDGIYFGLSKKAVPEELLVRLMEAYNRTKMKGALEAISNKYQ